VLSRTEDVVFRQKTTDAGVDDMFKDFAADGGQRNWSVVFRKFLCVLFVQCEDVSNTPISRDYARAK